MKFRKRFGVAALAVLALFMTASLSFAADVTVDFSAITPAIPAPDPFQGGSLNTNQITISGVTATGYFNTG